MTDETRKDDQAEEDAAATDQPADDGEDEGEASATVETKVSSPRADQGGDR